MVAPSEYGEIRQFTAGREYRWVLVVASPFVASKTIRDPSAHNLGGVVLIERGGRGEEL